MAARAALRTGLSVLPVDAGTKRPLLEWKAYQSTAPTLDEVEAWWKGWPRAGLGIVTGVVSSLVVVDVDSERAEAFDQVLARFGETSRITRTPRGGAHLYYKHPGRPVSNGVHLQGFNFAVDLRGDGGYVLAPPSPGYRWERRGPFESVPAFRTDALSATSGHGCIRTATNCSKIGVSGVAKGERNSTLVRFLGRWLGVDRVPEEVARLAAQGFGARCRPPMDHAEVDRTFASIAGRERAKRRIGTATLETLLLRELGQ